MKGHKKGQRAIKVISYGRIFVEGGNLMVISKIKLSDIKKLVIHINKEVSNG